MQIPGWVRRRLRWKAVPPSLLLLWDVLKKASHWIYTGIKTGGDLDFLGLWDTLVGFVKEWDGLIAPAIGVAWLWWIGREARGKAAPIERNRTQGAFDNGLLKIPTGTWLHQTVYDVDYTMLDETSPKIRFRVSIFNGSRKFGSSGFLVGGQRVAGSSILPTRRRPQSHRSPKGGQEIPKYPTRQSGRGQLVKGIRH